MAITGPEVARKFLNAFHEEKKIQEAQQRRLPDAIAEYRQANPHAGDFSLKRQLEQLYVECLEQFPAVAIDNAKPGESSA